MDSVAPIPTPVVLPLKRIELGRITPQLITPDDPPLNPCGRAI